MCGSLRYLRGLPCWESSGPRSDMNRSQRTHPSTDLEVTGPCSLCGWSPCWGRSLLQGHGPEASRGELIQVQKGSSQPPFCGYLRARRCLTERGCPGHCRMSRGILDPYPLDAMAPPPICDIKNASRHGQCALCSRQNCLILEQQVLEMSVMIGELLCTEKYFLPSFFTF